MTIPFCKETMKAHQASRRAGTLRVRVADERVVLTLMLHKLSRLGLSGQAITDFSGKFYG